MISIFIFSCQQVLLPTEKHSADTPKRWKQLINLIANEEHVNYPLLLKNKKTLNEYMSWLAVHGPYSDHYSIREEKRKIVFYANAYNASVLFSVLENWPLNSVKDVDAGWFQSENVGFFLGQLFQIDGDYMSLFHLEQDLILSQSQDPRVHVMLNCASKGCPPLRFWSVKGYNRELNKRWKQYIQNNVRKINNERQASELFFWYKKDLLGWSSSPNLCHYLSSYLSGEASVWMQEHTVDCRLQFFPYDWSLND